MFSLYRSQFFMLLLLIPYFWCIFQSIFFLCLSCYQIFSYRSRMSMIWTLAIKMDHVQLASSIHARRSSILFLAKKNTLFFICERSIFFILPTARKEVRVRKSSELFSVTHYDNHFRSITNQRCPILVLFENFPEFCLVIGHIIFIIQSL